jgi:hypothetical protein
MTFSLGMYVDGTLCKWAVHLHPEVMANWYLLAWLP